MPPPDDDASSDDSPSRFTHSKMTWIVKVGDLDHAKKRDLLERALVIRGWYYGPDHAEAAIRLK